MKKQVGIGDLEGTFWGFFVIGVWILAMTSISRIEVWANATKAALTGVAIAPNTTDELICLVVIGGANLALTVVAIVMADSDF